MNIEELETNDFLEEPAPPPAPPRGSEPLRNTQTLWQQLQEDMVAESSSLKQERRLWVQQQVPDAARPNCQPVRGFVPPQHLPQLTPQATQTPRDVPAPSHHSNGDPRGSGVSDQTSFAPRILPGPAGRLQQTSTAAPGDAQLTFALPAALDSPGQDARDFPTESPTCIVFPGPWLAAMETLDQAEFNEASPLLQHNAKSIRKLKSASRIPQTVFMVVSVKPNGSGDVHVRLKDPTGTVPGSIHREVVEAEQGITPGAVLMLQQVCCLVPAPGTHYLCITANNLIQVLAPEATGEAQQLPPRPLEAIIGEAPSQLPRALTVRRGDPLDGAPAVRDRAEGPWWCPEEPLFQAIGAGDKQRPAMEAGRGPGGVQEEDLLPPFKLAGVPGGGSRPVAGGTQQNIGHGPHPAVQASGCPLISEASGASSRTTACSFGKAMSPTFQGAFPSQHCQEDDLAELMYGMEDSAEG